MGKIVVGIDSTDASVAALEWAINEARLRRCHLDVVVSWDYPIMVAAEPMMVQAPDRDLLVNSARVTAEKLAADVGLTTAGIDYSVHTPEGRAGEELVAMAADADLLVVGSHGSGVLKELLLGSVSNYCAHHSTCPVVLVRARHHAHA
jgi:nucleotide-binding universal stress UspA family protein